MNQDKKLTTTLVLFLRSEKSKNKFAEALEWVKARNRTTWLPLFKVWALDTETDHRDPALSRLVDEAKEAGWSIAGEAYLDAGYDPKSIASRKALNDAAEKAASPRSGGTWSK